MSLHDARIEVVLCFVGQATKRGAFRGVLDAFFVHAATIRFDASLTPRLSGLRSPVVFRPGDDFTLGGHEVGTRVLPRRPFSSSPWFGPRASDVWKDQQLGSGVSGWSRGPQQARGRCASACVVV